MSKKYLRVTMPDGSKWDVPAKIIAENRATYYAMRDTECSTGPKFKKAYKDELKYTLSDDGLLCDWSANNMNWGDVEKFATKVQDSDFTDFQEGWVNGSQEIILK